MNPEGLQAERTRLAWRRTMLAFSVVSLLFLHPSFEGPAKPGSLVAVAFVALLWGAVLVVTHRRIEAMAADEPPPLTAATVYPLLVLVLLLCGAGLWVGLWA